jgi:1,4-dihydroxy-2-naphthoate octaprenyltransferase
MLRWYSLLAMKLWIWIKEFLKAMRLFSLTLALGATTLGILAAWRAGVLESPISFNTILLFCLVTIAGLASQLGANLINDYFEGSFKYTDPSVKRLRFLGKDRTVFDVFVFLSGIAALGLAGLIGLYLVYITDWIMLVIGLIGLIGSYAYTGEPFVYKIRGLGAILSFLLMGPLMTLGAYYPFAKSLSWYPVVIGLPLAILVPALMISNEMRDFKRDDRLSMNTLSTIIGHRWSLKLYEFLVFGSFVLVGLYAALGLYPLQSLVVFALLPVALKARSCVARFERLSIPWTNRLHLGFFIILTTTLWIW